jgi:hypothetical protein
LHSDGLTIPFSEIGTIFGVSKATVIKHSQRSLSERQRIGRAFSVDGVVWQQFKELVFQRFENQCAMTSNDALDFFSAQFDVHLLPNTLWKKISVDHELPVVRGVPMEKERLECDLDEIRAHFELLDRNVTGAPAAFVFNLDESGFQDWADRLERMVIVPSACQTDKVGIPIDRYTKRSSLLVGIATDGTFLKPMLILPRKTIEKELLEQGINDGVGKLIYQENGFITGGLFREWCAEVFFPEIQNRREHYQY